MAAETQASTVRRFGVFEIDLQSGELRKNGMRLRLSGQPLQVLATLIERAGDVVTREELHSKLWPADTYVDFDHGLNSAVSRIREALDDSSDTPRYVETIPRRGYRFIASVTNVHPARLAGLAADSEIGAEKTAISGTSAPFATTKKGLISTRPMVWFVGVVVIAALAASFALYRGKVHGAGQPAIKSVAVMPLTNLSGDPTQEYLADGITEELIGRLAGIHNLRVISRTSVMGFKDTRMSAPEIARALNVDALVEGSVIREGDRIRVHAQLIRGASDEHFWSETYDREIADVLALESDVARSIAEKVEVTVTGQEHSRLVAARYVSPEVYESYQKGQSQLDNGNTKPEIEKAVTYFEEALRKDPTFAPAYVGLANAYDDLSDEFVGGSPGELRPKVIDAAQKALKLDPELAEAHVVLGEIDQEEWRWGEAEGEYKRALELKPNNPSAVIGFSDWLLRQGRTEEALVWSRHARELDPIGIRGFGEAWILFHTGRFEEAIREFRNFAARYPDDAFAKRTLGFMLIANGQVEEAIPILEKTVSMMHRSAGSIELLATANARAGHREEAIRLLNELKGRRETSYIPASTLITPSLALGNYDEAFVWFERAYEEKSDILLGLKINPFFDPVRQDPRFRDLLRRVGLNN